jgi:hypothetical protein
MDRYYAFRLLLLAITLFATAATAQTQVVINEYCASNKSLLIDAFSDYPDWIELYNSSGNPVNLAGYYLSDSPGNLHKWALPSQTLGAGQRILFFASNRNGYFGAHYHTSFKLTQMKQEMIILSNGVNNIVDSLTMKTTQPNHSRGRMSDGNALWGVFTAPSPDAMNNTTFTRYALTPQFSIGPGFYPSAQTLTLTTPEPGVTIRYTTNGDIPTAASPMYAGPINITATTIVRARAFSSFGNILPSFTETNTYFINANHHNLAVISLAGDYNTLFNGFGGEIMSTFEYFDTLGSMAHEGDGDIRGHGNDSWAYDQKGIRFYARDDYGYANNIEFPLFNATPRDEFDVIILKAGASDNFPGGFQNGLNTCHLRDVFAQTLAQKHQMHVDNRSWEPCVVYINGQYWGIYEIRERVDADYADYYYDQSVDSVDFLAFWGGLTIEEGSDTAWNSLYNFMVSNNLSIPANHDYVEQRFDLMSLIDYFIINTYLVNTDWLNWNTAWWRGRSTPGVRWRYRLWDMDNILNLGQNYTGVSTTTYLMDPCNPTTLFPNDPQIPHTDMMNALMADSLFENMYINRYADLLNTALHCDTLMAHLDWIVNRLAPEMPQHCARWGGLVSDWEDNLDTLREQITGRCIVVDSLMVGCYNLTGPYDITVLVDPPGFGDVRVNTVVPPGYPYVGGYYGGVTVNLKALNTQGYPFVNWSVLHHTLTPGLNADSVSLYLSSTDTLVAHFDSTFVGGIMGGLEDGYAFQVRPTLVHNRMVAEWQLPVEDAATALVITDMQGRQVADLSYLLQDRAYQRLDLNLESLRLTQGMYMIRLQTRAWQETEKIIWVGE